MSLFYAVMYVLRWRSISLSAVITAGFVFIVYFPNLRTAVMLASVSAWMLLLSNERFQTELLTGGVSAPLSDGGFEIVAKMKDTEQMMVWLARVVEDLPAKVKKE